MRGYTSLYGPSICETRTCLAEIHTLHTFATQRRTNRRRWRRLSGTHYQLDNLICRYRFLRHCDVLQLSRVPQGSCGSLSELDRNGGIIIHAIPEIHQVAST
jgi:hypothetical protein